MPCALRIGLTGGIGSGKTEVSRYFAALGVPVIDTDIIAHELVTRGQPALAEIAAEFGDGILDEHGNLDRARLRSIVFSDPARRRQLEKILHPRIRDKALALSEQCDAAYCIIVIPLLVESGQDYPLDRILVVDVPVEVQYRRIARRDGISREEIASILAAQAGRDTRLRAADDVVVNDGDIEDLHRKIDELHERYLELAPSDANER
jgi:dephospho-CoA kinase